MTATTLGLHLAAKPKRTALCVIAWAGDHADVVALREGRDAGASKLDDRLIVSAMRGAWGDLPMPVKVAIDAPLGWPVDLVRALAGSGPWPGLDADRRGLERRATDEWVRRVAKQRPPSVTTEPHAYAAMRAAGLLAHCAATGHDVIDVSGVTGLVCETSPEPAIRRLGLWPPDAGRRQRYKEDAAPLRASIMDRLREAAPWLQLSAEFRDACVESDRCLDALVCALIARALRNGQTVGPPAELAGRARSEGWIHLPTRSFVFADLL